jgi:hypothetical protein
MKPDYKILFQPFGAFQLDDFGKPEKEEEILKVFNENISFLGAQMAGALQRKELDESSISKLSEINAAYVRPFKAKVWDTRRQRLVQNVAITYTLVGILSLVVGIHIWALVSMILVRRCQHDGQRRRVSRWLTDFELRGLAPEGFSSMEKTETLLKGSNYALVMPENASKMTQDELQRHLVPDGVFRIGWFADKKASERIFTIGVVDDALFQFIEDS